MGAIGGQRRREAVGVRRGAGNRARARSSVANVAGRAIGRTRPPGGRANRRPERRRRPRANRPSFPRSRERRSLDYASRRTRREASRDGARSRAHASADASDATAGARSLGFAIRGRQRRSTYLVLDAHDAIIHDGPVPALDVEQRVVQAVRGAAAEHHGLHHARDDPRGRELDVPDVLHRAGVPWAFPEARRTMMISETARTTRRRR